MNYFFNNNQKKGQKAGFTVLYAMLMAILLLSIGLSIYNILLKELTLSSDATNSQIAFSAADSGFECALYWDTKGYGGESVFPDSSADTEYALPGSGPGEINATCNSQIINNWNSADPQVSADSADSTFTVIYGANGSIVQSNPCAQVTVSKTIDAGGQVTTTVDSLGYSTCVLTDPHVIQREVSLTY